MMWLFMNARNAKTKMPLCAPIATAKGKILMS